MIDGQLLLANGIKVAPRQTAAETRRFLSPWAFRNSASGRPVLTTLITVTIVVLGMFAYRLLPVAALPRVDFPTISITATLPGASPETMAASVASPIERQLSTISGISSMTSSSSLGTTQITVQFDLDRDIDGAALDVQTALTIAQRRLPVEMTTPPSFRKVNPGRFSGPVHQPDVVDTLPLSKVNEYGDTVLAQQISQLTGVAQVTDLWRAEVRGPRAGRSEAAAARGLSLDDVRTAVARANSSVAGRHHHRAATERHFASDRAAGKGRGLPRRRRRLA